MPDFSWPFSDLARDDVISGEVFKIRISTCTLSNSGKNCIQNNLFDFARTHVTYKRDCDFDHNTGTLGLTLPFYFKMLVKP